MITHTLVIKVMKTNTNTKRLLSAIFGAVFGFDGKRLVHNDVIAPKFLWQETIQFV